MLKSIFAREKGQGLVEYALILVLVAMVVIVILALLGPAVGNVFSNIVAAIEGVGGGAIKKAWTETGSGSSVTVYVVVSKPGATVSVSTSDGDVVAPSSRPCDGGECGCECHFNIVNPSSHGTATVTSEGSTRTVSW